MQVGKNAGIQNSYILNNLIISTDKNEQITDEVLEVLYNLKQKVPKWVDIRAEIAMLSSKEKLLASDEMFLSMLKTACVWLQKVGYRVYLELWTYERHIPWEV